MLLNGSSEGMLSSLFNRNKKERIKTGMLVDAGNAPIYKDTFGVFGYKQYFSQDPIYKVIGIGEHGFLLVRHHSLDSGITGWIKEKHVVPCKDTEIDDKAIEEQEVEGMPETKEILSNPTNIDDFEDGDL